MSNRVQTENLQEARPLNVPYVPKENVPMSSFRGSDTQLGQLAQSLSNLNPSLQGFADSLLGYMRKEGTEQGAIDFAQNPEKIREASKMEIGEAVKKGLLPEGANPFRISTAFEKAGESSVISQYYPALQAIKDSVTTYNNPEDIDQAIAKTRQEFLKGQSDNFYVQKGISKVLPNIEQQFKTDAVRERMANVEKGTLEDAAIRSRQINSSAEGIDFTNPDQIKNYSDGVQKDLDTWKFDMHIQDTNTKYFQQVVVPYAMSLAEIDPTKARQYLDVIENLKVTKDGAVYGNIGAVSLGLSDLRGKVDEVEAKGNQQNARLRLDSQEKTSSDIHDTVYDMVSKAQENGERIDSEWIDNKKQELSNLYADPTLQGKLDVALKEVTANATNPSISSNPDQLNYVSGLLERGDLVSAAALIDSSVRNQTMSIADALTLKKQVKDIQQVVPYMSATTYKAMASQIYDKYKKDPLTGTDTDPRVLVAVDPAGLFRQAFISEALKLKEANPNISSEEFRAKLPEALIKAYGTAEQTAETRKKQLVEEDRSIRQAESSNKILKSSPAIDPSSPIHDFIFGKASMDFDRYKKYGQRIEQIFAQSPDGVPDGTAKQEVLKLYNESKSAGQNIASDIALQLSVGRSSAWYLSDNMKSVTPMSQEEKKELLNKYMEVKQTLGFGADEILSGMTSDGIKINDVETPINPYISSVFKDRKELEIFRTHPDQQKALLNKLSVGDAAKFFAVQDALLKRRGM